MPLKVACFRKKKKEMKKKMKKMKKKIKKMKNVLLTIFSVFLLSILLPSVDVYTDLNLVYNLYVGTYSCNTTSEMKMQWKEYENCLTTHYTSDQCPHPRNSSEKFKDYDLCRQDSFKYCTSNSSRTKGFCSKTTENHPRIASSLLSFFMINYIVCMLTFFRLVKDRKDRIKLFIFPLLNVYPQYSEYSLKSSRINFLNIIF